MKRIMLIGFTLLFCAACTIGQQPPKEKPVDVLPQPSIPPTDLQDETLLFISGTTHIETKPTTWPNPDAFLDFLQQMTDLGIRWSVGADIGWLEGESRAAEVIQKSEAFGIQWDIHVHNMNDRGKANYLIKKFGGHPTGVYSGFLVKDFEKVILPNEFSGESWAATVLWGAVYCPGHRPGCDNDAVGLWSPLSGEEYDVHNPSGTIVHVGGGSHMLTDGRALLSAIANGEYDYPVISFTLMADPVTLAIASTGEGIEDFTAFYNEANEYLFVRWATIEETAQAWIEAGRVPSRIVLP